MVKFLEWFDQHDPFNVEVFSSLTATDEEMVNCDQVEEVGENIQKSVDGVAVTRAKIKKV